MGGLLGNDRRDGVLENQLLLVISLEHKRVFIKALNTAGKLDATHQINGEDDFVFACII